MRSDVKTDTSNVETVKYVNNTPRSLKETYGPNRRKRVEEDFTRKSRVKKYSNTVSVGGFTRDSV